MMFFPPVDFGGPVITLTEDELLQCSEFNHHRTRSKLERTGRPFNWTPYNDRDPEQVRLESVWGEFAFAKYYHVPMDFSIGRDKPMDFVIEGMRIDLKAGWGAALNVEMKKKDSTSRCRIYVFARVLGEGMICLPGWMPDTSVFADHHLENNKGGLGGQYYRIPEDELWPHPIFKI